MVPRFPLVPLVTGVQSWHAVCMCDAGVSGDESEVSVEANSQQLPGIPADEQRKVGTHWRSV